MAKTTVDLPDDLRRRSDAHAHTAGTSTTELVRRAITRLLDAEGELADRDDRPVFPVYDSGRSMTADEMHQVTVDRMVERADRR